MRDRVPPELLAILDGTPALERAYLVGGCVRDALLELPCKDYDIEAFGITYEELVGALAAWGRPDLVGRSFGVVKLTTAAGNTYDFSIPRRDAKTAAGHRGFEIQFDPESALEAAAARRDFTINAMLFDPRRDVIIDAFGGRRDLEQRVLRHTSAAFSEDPLRVLRGMQFCGRFNLTAAPETIELCQSIRGTFHELAIERVREEWFKWAERSIAPAQGIRFLVASGWVEHFPEVAALIGTSQDPVWHPEGDVFTHTCHSLDSLIELPAWIDAAAQSRIVMSLAVLCHDFAKPFTTFAQEKQGRTRIVSPGHDVAGVPIAATFLERIDAPLAIVERVLPLVRNHLAHLQTESARAVRRLAHRLQPATMRELVAVMIADQWGRPPLAKIPLASITSLEARALELGVELEPTQRLVLGRHLTALGFEPGPIFSQILDAAYEAQMDGLFTNVETGLRWIAQASELPIPDHLRARLR